jgi:HrpA-like RNA helicase
MYSIRAAVGERPDEAESEEDERAVRAREKQTAFEALQHSRTLLPMYEFREPLLKAIAEYQTLVIVGETVSGKTTQVQLCLYYSRCALDVIACVEVCVSHFVCSVCKAIACLQTPLL